MKQQRILAIFILLMALVLSACTAFSNFGKEGFIEPAEDPNKPSLTKIKFSNTNPFRVGVYTYTRDIPIMENVPGNGISNEISWVPSAEYPFYLTYHLDNLSPHIPEAAVPYIAPIDSGFFFFTWPIPRDKTTTVPIPNLDIDPDTVLFDHAWLAVNNSGSSTIRLTRGSSVIKSETGNELVNPGSIGMYKIPVGMANTPSNYKIKASNEMSLPAEITSFQAGYLYVVEINGSNAALADSKLLTLENIGYSGKPPVTTTITFTNATPYKVKVYSSADRDNENVIVEVPTNGVSEEIEWIPSDEDTFYLTYYIDKLSTHIPTETVSFIPPIDSEAYSVSAEILSGITNDITIPFLDDYIEPDEPLFNSNAYLAITNTSSFAFELQLLIDSTVISTETGDDTINPGSYGFYIFPAGDIITTPMEYRIVVGGDEYMLPMVFFQAGYLYVVEFDGTSADGLENKEITLGSIGD